MGFSLHWLPLSLPLPLLHCSVLFLFLSPLWVLLFFGLRDLLPLVAITNVFSQLSAAAATCHLPHAPPLSPLDEVRATRN